MKTGVIVASIPPRVSTLCVCVLFIFQVFHMQRPSRARGNVISPIFQMKKLKFFPKVIQLQSGHPRLPCSKAHAFNHHWHFIHFHFSLSGIGEGNGSPLQCPCLENPREGGAWWAAVYGVAQSRTRLKRLSGSSSGSDGKASACNVGDLGSIPGLRRFPGDRKGKPFQYSCLENPMDGGAW